MRLLGDAARIEGTGLHLVRRPIDLVALAHETLVRFDAGGRELTLSVSVRFDALPTSGDAAALKAVLRQLLNNAVLYSTPSANIRVEASMSDDGLMATIAVRDEGPAVPRAERHLLFRKFARLSTAGGTCGAGLALWVSRAVIEDNGGRIGASWPSADANVFSFSLPLRSTDQHDGTDAEIPPGDRPTS